MYYLLNTFSIVLLKLSPYLAAGLVLAAGLFILVRHLRRLTVGQGSCCSSERMPVLKITDREKYRCSGCSGCPDYSLSRKNGLKAAENQSQNNAANKVRSVEQ